MSLPSKCLFFYQDQEVLKISCNCGWWFDESRVHDVVLGAINDYMRYYKIKDYKDFPVWDKVYLYGNTYTRAQLLEMSKSGR